MSGVKDKSCCKKLDYIENGNNIISEQTLLADLGRMDKNSIGEELYLMVEAVHPKHVARKITGMLLEYDNTEIIQLIKDPDYLAEKIQESIQVLAEGFVRKEINTSECAICMDKLDNNKNFAKTNCQHSFCLTCLVESLKHNNRCPLCRANIEDETPSTTKALTLGDGVNLIQEELDMINLREHVELITMFDHPGVSLKHTLRIFGLGLVKSMIRFQSGEEYDDESSDEE
jgi:hypothetical protein